MDIQFSVSLEKEWEIKGMYRFYKYKFYSSKRWIFYVNDSMLIDVTFDNEILNFIDNHSRYNHIFIIK